MDSKKEKVTPPKAEKLTGLQTPVVLSTGFGVSVARDLLVINFVFTPPEDKTIVNVIYRVGLLPEAAEELAKTLNEALEKAAKVTEPKKEDKPAEIKE